MIFGKKKVTVTPYDKETESPVIYSGICSGEQIAGFRNHKTGKFTEIMLLKSKEDLDLFIKKYDINPGDIRKEY